MNEYHVKGESSLPGIDRFIIYEYSKKDSVCVLKLERAFVQKKEKKSKKADGKLFADLSLLFRLSETEKLKYLKELNVFCCFVVL